MGKHCFREGRDYEWRPREAWWHALPIVADYARRAVLLRDYVFEVGVSPYGFQRYRIAAGYQWNGVSAGAIFARVRSLALLAAALVGAAIGAVVTLLTGLPWPFALGAIAVAVAACFVLWPRPDDPRLMRASLIHDWIYERRPRGVSQAAADALFFAPLEEDGAPLPFRWAADTPLAHRLYRWAWERGVT